MKPSFLYPRFSIFSSDLFVPFVVSLACPEFIEGNPERNAAFGIQPDKHVFYNSKLWP